MLLSLLPRIKVACYIQGHDRITHDTIFLSIIRFNNVLLYYYFENLTLDYML